MKDIAIEITESPLIDATIPVLETITDLVGDGFQFTRAAMGGMISASLNFTCDAVTAWRIMGNYIGKRIVFSSPFAKNTDTYSAPSVWDGMIYTVRVEVDGAVVSRSMENIYNSIDVQYAEIIANLTGLQKTTTLTTDASSIALYGTRRLRTSAGAMTYSDAYYLRDVMITQYRDALSTATATNKRTSSPYAPRISANQVAKVAIDCVGYWEYFDKTLYSNTDTTNLNVSEIVAAIFVAAETANAGLLLADYDGITYNTLQRTQFFSETQSYTCKAAIEACCSLGDLSSGFAWCAGLGPHRAPYFRVMDFTQKYITQLSDPSGLIYDASSGEEVKPWLVEPGYLIKVDDLIPDAVTYTYGTAEARNQMIDSVTFAAPNSVAWQPRLASDLINLKLSRLGIGYFNSDYPRNFWSPS